MKRQETVTQTNTRRLRAQKVLKQLEILFPTAGMMLNFKNHWELLVAVQLSAQCTDKKVNEVTPRLFAHYPNFADYLVADPKEFAQYIFQTGYYNNKTKNILAAAKYVAERFGSVLPRTMNEMLEIPGVARKTANVVLGNAYGVTEGIAVDTHVKRMARVLGLSDEMNPNNIEKDLMEIIPSSLWFRSTYLFIEYGRRYCPARVHDQKKCPLGHFEWGS